MLFLLAPTCLPPAWLQRNILEDPARGYLQNDTIIIKYTIELVVSTGGALSRQNPNKTEMIKVPPPSIGQDLGDLFKSGVWPVAVVPMCH